LDYTEEDRTKRVREATDGNGADVILKMVGGDFPQKSLRCLNTLGCMVIFGGTSGDRGSLVPAELMKKNHSVVGFYLPNTMHRTIQSQRSASASRETTGKVVPNPPKEAAG